MQPNNPLPRIGVQLYSLHEEMAHDVAATVRHVAELGFLGVETAGLHGLQPLVFRRLLDELDLEHISAFVGLTPEGLTPETLEFAHASGARRLVVNAWEADFRNCDSLDRLVASVNRAAEQAMEVGCPLGYHNHFWEFAPSEVGDVPMLEFVARLETCFVELDMYWLASARPDWREILAELADSVQLLHVKDGPGTLPSPDWVVDPMVPAGSGVVDVTAFARATRNATWHIVEFDSFDGDVFDGVAASLRYLAGSGLSRSRSD